MKHAPAITVILALLCSALPALAQEMKQEDMQHGMQTNMQPNMSTAAAAPQVSGEIRKVDPEAGKVTIRHAEIPNLGMPPMTMVFRAAMPDLLANIKAGDQVLFTAANSNGVLSVTSIERQP